MLDPIFRFSQLTLPVATILSSALVVVNNHSEAGVWIFIGGAVLTLLLRYIEQETFEYNRVKGYIRG